MSPSTLAKAPIWLRWIEHAKQVGVYLQPEDLPPTSEQEACPSAVLCCPALLIAHCSACPAWPCIRAQI